MKYSKQKLSKKNTWEQAGVIASATSFSLSQSLISSSESNNLNDGISSPKKGVLLLKCVILDLNLFATFLTRLRAAKEWPGEHKGRKEQYSVHPSENHDKGFKKKWQWNKEMIPSLVSFRMLFLVLKYATSGVNKGSSDRKGKKKN